MAEESNSSNLQIFDHPEVKKYFSEQFNEILGESDRGAVLIAAEEVNNQLERLFVEIAPSDISKSKLKQKLNYQGVLSSFASRNDVAYLTRLIPADLWKAIDSLRVIRNKAAHSNSNFLLKEIERELRDVFELSEGLSIGVNRIALDLLMQGFVGRMLELEDPLADEPTSYFQSPSDAIEYLSEHPDVLEDLGGQLLKWELGVGTSIICALLVFYRERLKEKVGNHTWLSLNEQLFEDTK